MVGEDIQPDPENKHPHDHHMNEEEKKTVFKKYSDLKKDFQIYKDKSANSYDYYNLIEKTVLEMEESDDNNIKVSDEMIQVNGMKREELSKMVQ